MKNSDDIRSRPDNPKSVFEVQHYRRTHVICALERLFVDYPHGFYYFYEPCKHTLYQEGHSWFENIDFCRRVFQITFDRWELGIRYKTKADFLKADDPFQDCYYASYYDPEPRLTYYLRNHDIVEERLKKSLWFSPPPDISDKICFSPAKHHASLKEGVAHLLSTKQLSQRWRINQEALTRWLKNGLAQSHVQIGRRIFYSVDEVQCIETDRLRPALSIYV